MAEKRYRTTQEILFSVVILVAVFCGICSISADLRAATQSPEDVTSYQVKDLTERVHSLEDKLTAVSQDVRELKLMVDSLLWLGRIIVTVLLGAVVQKFINRKKDTPALIEVVGGDK